MTRARVTLGRVLSVDGVTCFAHRIGVSQQWASDILAELGFTGTGGNGQNRKKRRENAADVELDVELLYNSVSNRIGSDTGATIAGLPLEVTEGEWVTLRSLFEPFGKEVSKQVERLQTWANLRKVGLPSRGGARDSAGNPVPSPTWTIHQTHVAQAISTGIWPRARVIGLRASGARVFRARNGRPQEGPDARYPTRGPL